MVGHELSNPLQAFAIPTLFEKSKKLTQPI